MIYLLYIFYITLVYSFNKPLVFLDKSSSINSFQNKKLITISPGGIGGFYMLGINSFIKKYYHTDNLHFLGASAGAWNTLIYAYKHNDIDYLVNTILDYNYSSTNINDIEYEIKHVIMNNFDANDFNFKNIYIGASIFTTKGFRPTTICGINDLEQALDCCIASSHIPFITGGILHKLNKQYLFDGGFPGFPPKYIDPYYEITWDMWDYKIDKHLIVPKNSTIINNLYIDGYIDTAKNKKYLDKLFIPKKIKYYFTTY